MNRTFAAAFAALVLAAPHAARADLGPHPPSDCEGLVAGQPCKKGSVDGTCLKQALGRRSILVCTPPLDPSAYPPVPDPYASSSAAPSSSTGTTSSGSTSSSTASSGDAGTPPSGGCRCGFAEAEGSLLGSACFVVAAVVARTRRSFRNGRHEARLSR